MNSPPPKIARLFTHGAWAALIILFTLFFANRERDKINPNQQVASASTDGSTEVVLKANHHHHYVANGTINGHPVTFMIDTGASDVAIPAQLGHKLGLTPGEKGLSTTANGDVTVFRTRINTLQLGDITLNDIKGSLNPGMDAEDEILLGMTFLKHLDFTQKDDVLTLRTKDR
jgi:aspartyl protease family protein